VAGFEAHIGAYGGVLAGVLRNDATT